MAVALVFASGCLTSPEQESLTPAPPDAETPGPSLSSLPPDLLTRPVMTCGRGEHFPAEGLLLPGFAEVGPDGASAALRSFLDSPPPGEQFPRTGWHRVLESENEVLFLAPRPAGMPWMVVSFKRQASGWDVDSYGECTGSLALPEGISPAFWWLNPAAGPPAPDAMELSAIMVEQSCAGGISPEGRILEPAVVYTRNEILIAIALRDVLGDCGANPPFPLEITLAQPIGDRTIFDAGAFPPRDASVRPPIP